MAVADPIRVGVSWMDDPAFAATVVPLLQAGQLDVVEWSFDTAWQPSPQTAAVLDAFAAEGRLVGHGVTFSVLSAADRTRQQAWLDRLRAECEARDYAHVSEHLGFLTAGGRLDGAPLPVPASPEVVRIGREAVARLSDAAGVPVGLENLALALSGREVEEEGALLDAILAPTDGFVVLDLHNLWCRACNQRRDPLDLLRTYPLGRVREVHVSGGSWDGSLRRDTHDDRVPDEVLALLAEAIPLLPGLTTVIVEQLPGALVTEAQQAGFRADVARARQVVQSASDAAPTAPSLASLPEGSLDLEALQCALLDALETASPEAVAEHVAPHAPGWTDDWDPRSVALAGRLVRHWTRR